MFGESKFMILDVSELWVIGIVGACSILGVLLSELMRDDRILA